MVAVAVLKPPMTVKVRRRETWVCASVCIDFEADCFSNSDDDSAPVRERLRVNDGELILKAEKLFVSDSARITEDVCVLANEDCVTDVDDVCGQ